MFCPKTGAKILYAPYIKVDSNQILKTIEVSLINSISKIFTGILTSRLQIWAEEKEVIDESQAGFRKGYSAIDNVFSLQALIQKYLCHSRGRFYCLFVDFRRAFDSIAHNKLWDSYKGRVLTNKANL